MEFSKNGDVLPIKRGIFGHRESDIRLMNRGGVAPRYFAHSFGGNYMSVYSLFTPKPIQCKHVIYILYIYVPSSVTNVQLHLQDIGWWLVSVATE